MTLPDRFGPLVVDRCKYYTYMLRSDPDHANLSNRDYQRKLSLFYFMDGSKDIPNIPGWPSNLTSNVPNLLNIRLNMRKKLPLLKQTLTRPWLTERK